MSMFWWEINLKTMDQSQSDHNISSTVEEATQIIVKERKLFLAPQIEYSAFLPVSTNLIFLAFIR